ncbi:hypothetical protein [Sporomusa acidovorans]|uniref:Uncharacterized protein n=1 Tax=Sporomusa acidovorans (strain ATCC 49682 / DSM 3132 / Mol) TaxID=1123286 RepID=A0ABZ3JAP2_SPOA4|nr:hypothetical protein [Sporomusa acidovorans]OZC21807.1 hypothetical protein SPACI_18820 [Sporomusa acidovorans DSM 3132]SDD56270.1 hypothetical protein SAMN04488499_100251 [Sporomusa acidovorans]
MNLKAKQIELAQSVPAIIGLLPSKRQELVSTVGREMAAIAVNAGLTIREQQAAIAVADLYLQFCQEDANNQKWSNLRDDAYTRDELRDNVNG